MICIKWRKARQCLALAGVLLPLAVSLILVTWDSLLLWRIQKCIAGYSRDDSHLQMQRLRSVDKHARYLRSERKRNTILMLNAARTFLAETEVGRTNEAYIAFIHLKSLISFCCGKEKGSQEEAHRLSCELQIRRQEKAECASFSMNKRT
jgi:hypothetical protein